MTAVRPQLPPPRPVSDNNLINGKMNFDCSTASDKTVQCSNYAGLAEFQFHSGSRNRLRLINTGAEATQQFSIDNHTMTVIANDFVPVEVGCAGTLFPMLFLTQVHSRTTPQW